MSKFLLFAITATSPLFLGACSTAPPMDTGQRISQRGGVIGDYGKAWSDGQGEVRQGQRMVEKGNKQSVDGEKQLARAREQVANAEARIRAAQADRSNGEQLIASGTAQMQRAEADYTAVRTGPPAVGVNPE